MKLIEDLGMIFYSETSLQKKHYAIVECPECKIQLKTIVPRGLKSAMCIACLKKSKTLPPINVSKCKMKLITDLGKQFPTETSLQKTRYGIFECSECKSQIKLAVNDAIRRASSMCDKCYEPILRQKLTTHGDSKGTGSEYMSLYRRWNHFKARCNNPEDASYKNYGGRGITVCPEWDNDYEIFKSWALANGYEEHLTIDRINTDGNYCPENCRWTTNTIQARNRNKTSNKRSSKYKGVSSKGTKFVARIMINTKTINLGVYQSEEEAALAYNIYVLNNNLEHHLNQIN